MSARENEALNAMLAHHRELVSGVEQRVAALTGAAAAGTPAAAGAGNAAAGAGNAAAGAGALTAASADLTAYLESEVLPHAQAEEDTLYRAAAAVPGLAATVAGMIEEHRELAAAAARLPGARDGSSAVMQAKLLAALFSAHVAKENDVLLPALAADPAVDLASLLAEMHQALTAAHRAGDEPVLDVRALAPAQRHGAIFAAYHALAPGAAFQLVNDHDPKPLRYQLEAEHSGEFSWAYLEEGPETWRVRIGRPAGQGDATR